MDIYIYIYIYIYVAIAYVANIEMYGIYSTYVCIVN